MLLIWHIIGIKGSRVLDRWTIADLPGNFWATLTGWYGANSSAGLTDTHKARVDTTLSYIKNCDHLYLLDRLGRIITSGVVDGHVQTYGRAFGNNISVITSKCDEGIGDEVVKKLSKSMPDFKEAEKEWKTKSSALTKQIKSKENPPTTKKGAKKKKKDDEKTKELSPEVMADIAKLKEARKKLDNEWWESVFPARNEDIIPALQKANRPHLPADSQLTVFCVSNTHYMALKDPDSQHSLTFKLSAEGTGIPGVRSHLLSLAASPDFRGLQNFINHDFSVVIGGCELWTSSELVASRAELVSIVKHLQKDILGFFE